MLLLVVVARRASKVPGVPWLRFDVFLLVVGLDQLCFST